MGGLHLSGSLSDKLAGLKGGGKQVPWGKIKENNSWYIDKVFLGKREFYNPTRLPEYSVKEFWGLWYGLEQTGKPFVFKRTLDIGAGDLKGGGALESDRGGSDDDDAMKVDGVVTPNSGAHQQEESVVRTPNLCVSDEERVAFLRSLLPQEEYEFHSVVNAVSSMDVSVQPLCGFPPADSLANIS